MVTVKSNVNANMPAMTKVLKKEFVAALKAHPSCFVGLFPFRNKNVSVDADILVSTLQTNINPVWSDSDFRKVVKATDRELDFVGKDGISTLTLVEQGVHADYFRYGLFYIMRRTTEGSVPGTRTTFFLVYYLKP